MQFVSADEAASNLGRLLGCIETGEEILILRGDRPVAKLVPIVPSFTGPRPKVGEMISPPFNIGDDCLASFPIF